MGFTIVDWLAAFAFLDAIDESDCCFVAAAYVRCVGHGMGPLDWVSDVVLVVYRAFVVGEACVGIHGLWLSLLLLLLDGCGCCCCCCCCWRSAAARAMLEAWVLVLCGITVV